MAIKVILNTNIDMNQLYNISLFQIELSNKLIFILLLIICLDLFHYKNQSIYKFYFFHTKESLIFFYFQIAGILRYRRIYLINAYH